MEARPVQSLRRVQQPRASDFIFEELRQAIHLRAFPPGDRLPPERELASRLGVSMLTLRLGLRTLEAEGYIVIRRGRGGGCFVNPTGDHASPLILARLRTHRSEIDDALRFRAVLEPAIAEHVATAHPSDLVGRLMPLVAAMDEAVGDDEFQRLDIEFHRAVAESVGSSSINASMDRIRSALATALDALPARQQWYRQSNAGHRALTEAVRVGNAEMARKVARSHLATTEAAVRLLLDPPPTGVR